MKTLYTLLITQLFCALAVDGRPVGRLFEINEGLHAGSYISNEGIYPSEKSSLEQGFWLAPHQNFLLQGEWLYVAPQVFQTVADTTKKDASSLQRVRASITWSPKLNERTYFNLRWRDPAQTVNRGLWQFDFSLFRDFGETNRFFRIGMGTLGWGEQHLLKFHGGYFNGFWEIAVEPSWSSNLTYIDLIFKLDTPAGIGFDLIYSLNEGKEKSPPLKGAVHYKMLLSGPSEEKSSFRGYQIELLFSPFVYYAGDSLGLGLPREGVLFEAQAPLLHSNNHLLSLVYQGVWQNRGYNQDTFATHPFFLRWHPRLAYSFRGIGIYPVLIGGFTGSDQWGSVGRLLWFYPGWSPSVVEGHYLSSFDFSNPDWGIKLSHPLHPLWKVTSASELHLFAEGGWLKSFSRMGAGLQWGGKQWNSRWSAGVDFIDENRAAYLGAQIEMSFENYFWEGKALKVYPAAHLMFWGEHRQGIESRLPAQKFWQREYFVNVNHSSVSHQTMNFESEDRDGDGLIDAYDNCPDQAEDRDQFQDDEGCPDLDNDRDGILDELDQCPNDAEDFDGFEDFEGCPEYDNDRDGVPDSTDQCPLLSEDSDQFQDQDGCPDLDNDGDGFLDEKDACPYNSEDFDGVEDEDGCPDLYDEDGIPPEMDECPEETEDFDGFEDADGCPELDNDEDGIPDSEDRCPNTPERFDGVFDYDGCP